MNKILKGLNSNTFNYIAEIKDAIIIEREPANYGAPGR